MPADLHARQRSRSRVVVVSSADCREVLQAALGNRGLETYATSSARSGLRLIRQHEPDVVVFDGEATDADDRAVQSELEAQLAERGTPLILLGRVRGGKLLPRHVLAKPYHFAPLVHTIEALAAAKAA